MAIRWWTHWCKAPRPSARKSVGAGLRWDARKNLAVKFQLDHTKLDQGSQGTLRNLHPGFQLGSSFNVLSATLDFVF